MVESEDGERPAGRCARRDAASRAESISGAAWAREGHAGPIANRRRALSGRPGGARRRGGRSRGSASGPAAGRRRSRSRTTRRTSRGSGSGCAYIVRVRRQIRAEQDPVGVAQEEGAGRVRLAAQLPEPRRDVDVEVRVASSMRPTSARSSAAHPTWAPMNVVRGCRPSTRSEGRPADSSNAPGTPGRRAGRRRSGRPEVPVRVVVELLPALVGRVERLEERDRVGDVDDHRDVELRGGLPERIESLVVHRHQPTGRIASPQAQQLPDLEPDGAALRPSREARAPPISPNDGSACPGVVVETREHAHPVRTGRRPALELARECLALASVQVDEQSRRPTRRAPRPAPPVRASPTRRRMAAPRWLWASTTANAGRRFT